MLWRRESLGVCATSLKFKWGPKSIADCGSNNETIATVTEFKF
jgi:hypothetical protein